METVLTGLLLWSHLWIVENDNGKWNHCLHARDSVGRDLLISYTGDAPLGKEGEQFYVSLDKITCTQVVRDGGRRESRPYPAGGFICNTDQAERQHNAPRGIRYESVY